MDNLAIIESLDQEGRGIARVAGKAIFIGDALPGERVSFHAYKRKRQYELANTTALLKQSSQRVRAPCIHFGVCGGCNLQHLAMPAQVAAKQRVLEDALWHISKVKADQILPAIHGSPWRYRHRARLTVRYVDKKGGALVGFHEKRSSYVADMRSCEVLPERISALLLPLRGLVNALSIRERIPQIEVAVGDDTAALVFRILRPLTPADENAMRQFAQEHDVHMFVQAAGPESAVALHPREATLSYRIPEFNLTLRFQPTDFVQVNPAINQMLLRRAVSLLDPRPEDTVVDFFCGVGNFSLPIARRGATVVGLEGNQGLVKRAEENAKTNNLHQSARFSTLNLAAVDAQTLTALGPFNKALIDPPREGGIALMHALRPMPVSRIVYVSCNPATLARDAAVLVHLNHFRLRAVGIVNMFPHTGHVESIAWFERT